MEKTAEVSERNLYKKTCLDIFPMFCHFAYKSGVSFARMNTAGVGDNVINDELETKCNNIMKIFFFEVTFIFRFTFSRW